MGGQYHVTGTVSDGRVVVSDRVVEQLFDLFEGVFGGGCLLGCDVSQCCEHGTVHYPRIVEECADNLLDESFSGRIESGGCIFVVGELLFCSIFWGNMCMWLVWWSFWSWVVETGECFLYVVWHEDVDSLVFVVPIDCQANVVAAFPLVADGVVFFDGLHEVFGVFSAHVFDAEIIDN